MGIWAEGPLPWELLEAIHKVGYAKPTPVQMQTIPIACQCRDLPGHAKKDIEQRLEFLGEAKKKKRLEEVLVGAEPPIIVFVNQKKAVDVLAKSLDNSGYRVAAIHGGKSQEQREWT